MDTIGVSLPHYHYHHSVATGRNSHEAPGRLNLTQTLTLLTFQIRAHRPEYLTTSGYAFFSLPPRREALISRTPSVLNTVTGHEERERPKARMSRVHLIVWHVDR